MQMGKRIKASEDFADIFALEFVGGRRVDGPHPKFVFQNEVQWSRYNEIRKRLKGGESLESIGNTST